MFKHGGLQEIIDTRQCPSITGISFGKPFMDRGKIIDTWPKWEKAGFRPLNINRDIKKESIKEKVAKKMWKIKRQGTKPLTESLM